MSHDEQVALRARAAMEHARERIEEEAVRFLLDALGVGSIAELRTLVEVGRASVEIDAAFAHALAGMQAR